MNVDTMNRKEWINNRTVAQFVNCMLVFTSVVLLLVVFNLYGNTTNIKLYGSSLFGWLTGRWQNLETGSFVNGFIILTSLVIVCFRFRSLLRVPKEIDWRGLVLIVMAMLLHWAATKAEQTRLSVVALMILMWAIPFFLYGWKFAALLRFPCAFLLFTIPLNFLDRVAYILVRVAVTISIGLARGFGVGVKRVGPMSFISLTDGAVFNCWHGLSDLGLLIFVMATAVLVGFFTQKRRRWQLIVAACGIPAFVIGSIFRIQLVAILGGGGASVRALQGGFGSFLVISSSVIFVLLVSGLLHFDWKAWFKAWKEHLLSPAS